MCHAVTGSASNSEFSIPTQPLMMILALHEWYAVLREHFGTIQSRLKMTRHDDGVTFPSGMHFDNPPFLLVLVRVSVVLSRVHLLRNKRSTSGSIWKYTLAPSNSTQPNMLQLENVYHYEKITPLNLRKTLYIKVERRK